MRVITPQLLSAVGVGFNTSFNQGIEGVQTSWSKIAMLCPSFGAAEIYPWLKALPGMREWIGERFINRLETEGFQVKNRKFEETYGVKREDIEDDKLGLYGPAFQMLGESAAQLPDELVWALLPAGFVTPTWDGQYFFDTDHPVLAKDSSVKSVSNFGGGTGPAWYLIKNTGIRRPFIYQKRTDVEFVRKDRIDDDNVFQSDEFLYGTRLRCNAAFGFWQLAYASKQPLTTANFNAAYDAMCAITGDYDRPIDTKPNLLVVPTNLRGAANAVIKAETIDGGVTNTNRDIVEVYVEQRLPTA